MKIWFQNRRTKWKKHENITALDLPEHKLQAEKNPDVAKAIQNAAKLKKAKERLEQVTGGVKKDIHTSLNQPLDFTMDRLKSYPNDIEEADETPESNTNIDKNSRHKNLHDTNACTQSGSADDSVSETKVGVGESRYAEDVTSGITSPSMNINADDSSEEHDSDNENTNEDEPNTVVINDECEQDVGKETEILQA